MADLAKLVVRLEAESSRLHSELEKANRKLDRFGAQARRTSGVFKQAFGIMGGVIAGISFKGLIDGAVNAASEISNLSTRLGGSVEEWSRLKHAAEQTDVGFQTMAMAAQRMTRRIAEAAKGAGEAVGALDELGLSAARLKDLAPTEQLYVLADALANVEDQSDRVRIAMKLFDSEGVKLLQMLDGGSDTLRRFTDESDRIGRTLSQDQVQAMHQYEMAMKEMDAAAEAFTNNLASALGPTLAEIAHWMADVLPAAANVAGEALSAVGRTFADRIFAWKQSRAALLAAAFRDDEEKLAALNREFEEATWKRLNLDMGKAANTVGEFAVKTGEADLAWQRFTGRTLTTSQAMKALEEPADDLDRALDMVEAQFRALDEEYARQIAGLQKVRDAMSDTAEQARDQWDDVLDIYIREEEENQRLWARQQAGLGRVQQQARETGDTWTELGGIMSSAFERAILEGDRLGDVLKALEQDLVRVIVRTTITDPFSKAVSGIGKSAGDWFGKVIGSIFGGGSVPARATGGPVEAGTAYLVGERGPELFVPGLSGAIVPNHALATGGGCDVVINVIESPGNGGRVAQRDEGGRRVIEVMVESVKGAIAQDITGGGGAVSAALERTYGLNRAAGAY